MSRRRHRHDADAPARGFALVPALFLMVVLALLAVIGVRVGVGQQQTVTMSLLQARALAAARTGIEWGAYRALNGSCVGSTTLSLSEASLNGFSVVVPCAATSFASGTGTSHAYSIAATATTGTYGQPGYTRRIMSGTFTDAS